MIWTLIASTLTATLVTLVIIKTAHHHGQWSADHEADKPQKTHVHDDVPRVGGVGIAAGLLAGLLSMTFFHGWPATKLLYLLVFCSVPVFALGLFEDLTKAVRPRYRLTAGAVSAFLGIYFFNAQFDHTGWPVLDAFLTGGGVALAVAFTIFAMTGVIHAINIIDGMNGLASMSVILMMLAICYIALQVGDSMVAGLALATLGACLGFFLWNYPNGLIFLGDGGAYLLGFMAAELGLLLAARHDQVSPLVPLALVAYPVFETLFTMYRRRILKGRSVGEPDGVHLHTLIFRRLMRWAVGSRDAQALTRANSMTSPYLWALSTLAIAPAAIWWDNSLALLLCMLVFTVLYLRLYWRIVRFNSPDWMKSRQFGDKFSSKSQPDKDTE